MSQIEDPAYVVRFVRRLRRLACSPEHTGDPLFDPFAIPGVVGRALGHDRGPILRVSTQVHWSIVDDQERPAITFTDQPIGLLFACPSVAPGARVQARELLASATGLVTLS
jgi:hypothetical protein